MKLEKKTDEEVMAILVAILESRASITTGFVRNENTGNLTHQVLRVVCGDTEMYSAPEELGTILRVANAAETGHRVN